MQWHHPQYGSSSSSASPSPSPTSPNGGLTNPTTTLNPHPQFTTVSRPNWSLHPQQQHQLLLQQQQQQQQQQAHPLAYLPRGVPLTQYQQPLPPTARAPLVKVEAMEDDVVDLTDSPPRSPSPIEVPSPPPSPRKMRTHIASKVPQQVPSPAPQVVTRSAEDVTARHSMKVPLPTHIQNPFPNLPPPTLVDPNLQYRTVEAIREPKSASYTDKHGNKFNIVNMDGNNQRYTYGANSGVINFSYSKDKDSFYAEESPQQQQDKNYTIINNHKYDNSYMIKPANAVMTSSKDSDKDMEDAPADNNRMAINDHTYHGKYMINPTSNDNLLIGKPADSGSFMINKPQNNSYVLNTAPVINKPPTHNFALNKPVPTNTYTINKPSNSDNYTISKIGGLSNNFMINKAAQPTPYSKPQHPSNSYSVGKASPNPMLNKGVPGMMLKPPPGSIGSPMYPDLESLNANLDIDVYKVKNTRTSTLFSPLSLQSVSDVELQLKRKFSLGTFNMLAPSLTLPKSLPGCPMNALAWEYRKYRLVSDIAHSNLDIIGLQECEYYDEFLAAALDIKGYTGICKNRPTKSDGCAVIWKSHKFTLVRSHVIDFSAFSKHPEDPFNHCMGLVVVLKRNDRGEGWIGDETLCVATTRIHFAEAEFKLKQTQMFLHEVYNFLNSPPKLKHENKVDENPAKRPKASTDMEVDSTPTSTQPTYPVPPTPQPLPKIPVIVCGDFNVNPTSIIYSFITSATGVLDLSCIKPEEFGARPGDNDPRLKGTLYHPLRGLKSAYANYSEGKEPLFTSYTDRSNGTNDYIFYHTSQLHLTKLLPLPTAESVYTMRGLPNAEWGSDHLFLGCELSMR